MTQQHVVTTGELLNSSPALARIVLDKLQFKSSKPVENVMNNCIQEDDDSEAYWIKPILSKTHDRLTHLNVRCANHDINAILNTESQLNICNVKLAQLLQLPIDKT